MNPWKIQGFFKNIIDTKCSVQEIFFQIEI